MDELTLPKCKAPVKDELASALLGALRFMSNLHDLVKEMREETSDLRNSRIQFTSEK